MLNQSLSQELASEIRKRLPTKRAVTDQDFAAVAGQALRKCPWAYDGSNSADAALRERVEIEWFGICPASSWEAKAKAVSDGPANQGSEDIGPA